MLGTRDPFQVKPSMYHDTAACILHEIALRQQPTGWYMRYPAPIEWMHHSNDLWILCKYNYCNLQLRDPNLDVCLARSANANATDAKWWLFRNCIFTANAVMIDRLTWRWRRSCDAENFKRQLIFVASKNCKNWMALFAWNRSDDGHRYSSSSSRSYHLSIPF